MSSLPKTIPEKSRRIADADDDTPAYCVVAQVGKTNTVFVGNVDEIGPLNKTKKLMETQANDT